MSTLNPPLPRRADYVVVVEFTAGPGQEAEFTRLLLANAEASRTQEPGCRVFDVCIRPGEPGRLFLYELYDDEAAFQAHLASAHFKAFDQAVAGIVASKVVQVMQRL